MKSPEVTDYSVKHAEQGAARVLPYLFASMHLAIGMAVINRAVLWRDEMATYQFMHLDIASLIHATDRVDRVLLPYYFLMHLWQEVFGSSAFAMRLPSLLAGAVTVAAATEIARRQWGIAAAAVTGVTLLANGEILWFSVEARPYALTIACVTVATLMIAAQRAAGSFKPSFFIGYIVVMTFAVGMNFLAILAIPAHLILLSSSRTIAIRWLLAIAAPVSASAAMLYISIGQRGQAQSIFSENLRWAAGILRDSLGMTKLSALLLIIAILASVVLQIVRKKLDRVWAAALLLCFIPAVSLYILATQFKLAFYTRYVTIIIVGAALLIGAAIGHMHTLSRSESVRDVAIKKRARFFEPILTTIFLAVILTLSFPHLRETFATTAKYGDNYEKLATTLGEVLKPGSIVTIPSSFGAGGRTMGIAYYTGDTQFVTDILNNLRGSGEPYAYHRRIVTLTADGLATIAMQTLPPGDVWSIDAAWTVADPPAANPAIARCSPMGPPREVDSDLFLTRLNCTEGGGQ